MYTRVLGLSIAAVILASGAGGALAQGQTTPQPVQQQAQPQPMGQEGAGMMGRGGMMGGGMMGRGMMGGGAMGSPPVMLRIIFALIDTDSDGTISLQEIPDGSRTDLQGNGYQQGWEAYAGGDASVHAWD